MKKLLLIILSMFMLITLGACANTSGNTVEHFPIKNMPLIFVMPNETVSVSNTFGDDDLIVTMYDTLMFLECKVYKGTDTIYGKYKEI